jgi:hypothetical protein
MPKFKLSKQDALDILVSTATVYVAISLTRKKYEKKIKQLEDSFESERYQIHSRAFQTAWEESRRYVHCYCGTHKESCVLHFDNLYPNADKKTA